MPPLPYRPRSGAERTRDAVLRWREALPAECYLVTAVPAAPAAGNVTHRRILAAGQVEGALPWLRHLNASGLGIVGRPWNTRHVLLDDLTPAALDILLRQHEPAAVVESSPGSLQAWITVAAGVIEPALADAAARLLATRFAGDRCAARAAQPGRLPGFTNRKPKHFVADRGAYPFALLHRAAGPLVDPGGAALLEEARTAIRPRRLAPPPAPCPPGAASNAPMVPAAEHAAGLFHLTATLPPGTVLNQSRADFAIAGRLLSRGLSVAEAVSVLLAGEKARRLAPAAAEAYARRTVAAARDALKRRPQPWAPPV